MTLTASNLIILIIGSALAFITIILIIWEAERQMYIFGLRPSEATTTDIAGLITTAKGIMGKVSIYYRPRVSGNVIYNITIRNDTVCVVSEARYKVSDCSSTVFMEVEGRGKLINASDFEVNIKKTPWGKVFVGLEEVV